MIISREQIEFLKKYLDNIEFEKIKKEDDDLESVLDAIDSKIIIEGMTSDQEWLTPEGIILQNIYDDIYNKNI